MQQFYLAVLILSIQIFKLQTYLLLINTHELAYIIKLSSKYSNSCYRQTAQKHRQYSMQEPRCVKTYYI